MKVKKITFFGYADSRESDPEYQDAFASAKILAEHGYTVVNGGGPGVMKAASLGAGAGGGKAIGVTFYPQEKNRITLFEGRDPSNPLGEEIKTESYLARTLKLIELGDAFVIFKGGTGTISEFGMAWGLARLYFHEHKHLILYGSWWHEVMESFGANMRLRPEELKVYHIVNSPTEVLDRVQVIETL